MLSPSQSLQLLFLFLGIESHTGTVVIRAEYTATSYSHKPPVLSDTSLCALLQLSTSVAYKHWTGRQTAYCSAGEALEGDWDVLSTPSRYVLNMTDARQGLQISVVGAVFYAAPVPKQTSRHPWECRSCQEGICLVTCSCPTHGHP